MSQMVHSPSSFQYILLPVRVACVLSYVHLNAGIRHSFYSRTSCTTYRNWQNLHPCLRHQSWSVHNIPPEGKQIDLIQAYAALPVWKLSFCISSRFLSLPPEEQTVWMSILCVNESPSLLPLLICGASSCSKQQPSWTHSAWVGLTLPHLHSCQSPFQESTSKVGHVIDFGVGPSHGWVT